MRMARCPLCGAVLDWAELIEQMLTDKNLEEVLQDKIWFMRTFEDFVFKCPKCGEEFYGRNLPQKEVEKVFELLNEFKGSIDWENRKVKLRINSLLALDTMLEGWNLRVKK